MPQLIVRRIEEKVVKKLKQQAGARGVSMEEEHRRILRESLLGNGHKRPSLMEYLSQMPDIGPDELFERNRDMGREGGSLRGYLLDTNVASERRKGRRMNANVLAWCESVDNEDVFLSVLVIGEIRKGIEQARLKDPVKVHALEGWLNGLEQQYGDRMLPITPAVANQWGRLSAVRPLSVVDGLLAATALVHDLTLVTRNVSDVADTGVSLLNPFAPS